MHKFQLDPKEMYGVEPTSKGKFLDPLLALKVAPPKIPSDK